MCRFDNVCLNHSSLAIQYHVSPQSAYPLFYDNDAMPHYNFPPTFVSTGAVRGCQLQ